QFVGNHVRERRLAEPGRAVQEDVVERLAALLRRLDRDVQLLAHLVLADVVVEPAGTESRVVLRVLLDARRRDDAIVGHFASSRSACFSVRSKLSSGTDFTADATAFSARGR